jgi:hypothetical protein
MKQTIIILMVAVAAALGIYIYYRQVEKGGGENTSKVTGKSVLDTKQNAIKAHQLLSDKYTSSSIQDSNFKPTPAGATMLNVTNGQYDSLCNALVILSSSIPIRDINKSDINKRLHQLVGKGANTASSVSIFGPTKVGDWDSQAMSLYSDLTNYIGGQCKGFLGALQLIKDQKIYNEQFNNVTNNYKNSPASYAANAQSLVSLLYKLQDASIDEMIMRIDYDVESQQQYKILPVGSKDGKIRASTMSDLFIPPIALFWEATKWLTVTDWHNPPVPSYYSQYGQGILDVHKQDIPPGDWIKPSMNPLKREFTQDQYRSSMLEDGKPSYYKRSQQIAIFMQGWQIAKNTKPSDNTLALVSTFVKLGVDVGTQNYIGAGVDTFKLISLTQN